MIQDLCGFDWPFTLEPYGPTWRRRRKAFHSQFQPQVVTRYRPMEEKSTHDLLRRLLDQPEEFRCHIRHMAGAETMLIGYGIKVQEKDDPYVQLAEEALRCAAACARAGAYLVDVFPIMKYIPAWFPGADFKRQAERWRVFVIGMRDRPYADHKTRAAAGDVPDCLATALLETLHRFDDNIKDAPFNDEDIKCTLGTMYSAAADTTVSTLQSFMLAMVLYPAVQAKGQAELDRVCPGRLPNFDDFDALPYIKAIMLEALRWNPVAPEAIPHHTTENDVYEGYFIQKGSIVIGNTWAILHDETHYPDPFTFNPDRYFRPDGTFDSDVLDPCVAAFGYGRRVCPGQWMAQDSMWITIACTLAAFSLDKKKDEAGNVVTPSGEYDNGLLCYPKPFPCEIRPRSEEHATLVKATSSS